MMFPITVLKVEQDDTFQMVTIDLSDVYYIGVDGTKIMFRTEDGLYYQITNIQEFEKHLRDHGFEKLDRPNLVNMKKIKRFDKNLRLVYFDENTNNDTPPVTVAQTKVNIVKKIHPITSDYSMNFIV